MQALFRKIAAALPGMESLSAAMMKLRFCAFPVLRPFVLMVTMSNLVTQASGYPVACTPTEAESHQRKCFDWLSEQSVRSEITMRLAERATPIAAMIAALSTLACCLPFGFLGAMGLASLSVWAQSFRNWFIGGAGVLLVVGFVQLYRGRNQCKKGSPVSIALFWCAVVMVLLIVLFPQVIANLLAG